MHGLSRLVVVLAAAALAAAPAVAQERVALVIGNSGYQTYPVLANPAADALLMEATLERVGFDVELVLDASRADMEGAFLRLNERLKAAGSDAVGLFYYAGHAIQSQGLNYLIPVDSTARVEPEVWTQAPRLGLLMDYLADAGNAANFVILDSCRNSPLPSGGRDLGGGLARIETGTTRGTLIAYATEPGRTASDGSGSTNSPYAAALGALLPTPGWTAETLFKQVATVVEEETLVDGVPAQSPWYENGLRGDDFCFAGCAAAGVVAGPDAQEILWQFVLEQHTPQSYESYLGRYGVEGRYGAEALQRLEDLVAADPEFVAARTGAASQPAKPRPVAPVVDPLVDAPAGGSTAGTPPAPVDVETFRDCDLCPEMAIVPAGDYVMGSPYEDELGSSNERPPHAVSVAGFAAARFETTWDQWQACVAAGACDGARLDRNGGDAGMGRGRQPLVNASWEDAQAYVGWLNQVTDGGYRLLTEEEWEYAARAGATGRYSNNGGDAELCAIANHADRTLGEDWSNRLCADGFADAAPVGSLAPNAFGLHDTAGNVSEWVESCGRLSYDSPPRCDTHAIRGGSFLDRASWQRSAHRQNEYSGNRAEDLGFRVAKTLE